MTNEQLKSLNQVHYLNDLYIFRIDVNNSKDEKKVVFPCVEENEVERSARSPKSACSCSPPESPNTSEPDEQLESPTNDAFHESPKKKPKLNSFSGVLGVATKS